MAPTPQGKGMSLNLGESMCVCAGIYTAALDGALKQYPGIQLTQRAAPSPRRCRRAVGDRAVPQGQPGRAVHRRAGR